MNVIEDLLRRTLSEVGARVTVADRAAPEVAQSPRHARSGRSAAIAAVIVVLVALVAVTQQDDTGEPSREVAAGPDGALARVGRFSVALADPPAGTPADATCVRLAPDDGYPVVCEGEPKRIAAEVVTAGSATIVYGVARGVVGLEGGIRQLATGDLDQTQHEAATVFLAVWNAAHADGVITGRTTDGATASFTIGRGIDDSVSAFEGLSTEPLFVYHHQMQVWALLPDGTTFQITAGEPTGHPFVSKDATVVAFGRESEAVFWDGVLLDLTDGSERKLPAFGMASFSDSGALAHAIPYDDEPATVEIVVRSPETYQELSRIPLGSSAEVGGIYGVSWVGDTIVVTTGHERPDALWKVEPTRRAARRIAVEPGKAWAVAEGPTQPVRAVRMDGKTAALVDISLDGAFRADVVATIRQPASGPTLDLADVRFLDSVGRVRVEELSDVAFTFADDDEPAYLIGDGRNLFLLSESGQLTYLLSDVAWAAAPQ